MFGKISISKFSNIIYDKSLSDTENLFSIIKTTPLAQFKIDADSFSEMSIVFHYNIYRNILNQKYPPELVFSLMMLGMKEVSLHSKKYNTDERETAFKELFLEIMGIINSAVESAKKDSQDIFLAITSVFLFSIFGKEQFSELISIIEEESLEISFEKIAKHFENLGKNPSILEYKVKM